MRAVYVEEFGPIASHEVKEVADPVPGEGQVLIENHAIGLNFPDALMLQGKYQKRPPRPFVPGRDCAGVVRAVGPGVTRCKPGDRVVAQVFTGAFGQLVLAPQIRCFTLPGEVSFEDAAAVITTMNTAWAAVDSRGKVKAGDTVLVTGAAGGVGIAAVQLCKARGATVLAAVSTPEKGKVALDNGADHIIDTNAADVTALKDHIKAQVNAITGAPEGRGCDVAIDTVGGDLFEACLRILRYAGNLVVVGFASTVVPAAKANYLLYNNLAVTGAPLDIRFEKEYGAVERGVNTWLSLLAEGKLKSNISGRYKLDEFATAFDQITGRKVMGKIVLNPAA